MKEKRWIQRIVEAGLPGDRKCFIFQVLVPYPVNVRKLGDEEVFEASREFVENSCRNPNPCGKIYDS
ncbi:MAG: DNA primase noncatalytic subunit PriX [Thermosphaera sp.]